MTVRLIKHRARSELRELRSRMVGRLGISTGRTIRVDASGRNCSAKKRRWSGTASLPGTNRPSKRKTKTPVLLKDRACVSDTRKLGFPDGSTVAAVC